MKSKISMQTTRKNICTEKNFTFIAFFSNKQQTSLNNPIICFIHSLVQISNIYKFRQLGKCFEVIYGSFIQKYLIVYNCNVHYNNHN